MASSDSEYVTVVAVEEGEKHPSSTPSFVTVLSISAATVDTEVVNVHRREHERLGFGLKFQGGTKSNERVDKLFIQSCAVDSPASRARATWGVLKEGDEILEIDSTDVRKLTRIQCVQRLKSGKDPLKLLIRDGKSPEKAKSKAEKRPAPPPPPPVPPRKIPTSRKTKAPDSQDPSLPPEAEFYLNLLDKNERKAAESDGDSASTLSTVIDKYSLCSSMSMSSISESEYEAITNSELAKVLKPFQLLEREFQLETTTKIEIVKPTEIKVVAVPPPATGVADKEEPRDYENVDVKSVATARNMVYENVEMKQPPTPKPRQSLTLPAKLPAPRVREFITIQTWLADATEVVHECPVSQQSDVNRIQVPAAPEPVEIPVEFDSSEEEGEKLGPPELLALPGPSEVYFNFPWAAATLPTIGEEGEDSSLDVTHGPVVVINSADDDDDRQVNVTCPQHGDAMAHEGTMETTITLEIDQNVSLIDAKLDMPASGRDLGLHHVSDGASGNADKGDKSGSLSMVKSIVVNNGGLDCQQEHGELTSNLVLNVSCEKKVDGVDIGEASRSCSSTNNNMSQMSMDEKVQLQSEFEPELIEFEERIILGVEHNGSNKSSGGEEGEVELCGRGREEEKHGGSAADEAQPESLAIVPVAGSGRVEFCKCQLAFMQAVF